jgi:hypothetical protein
MKEVSFGGETGETVAASASGLKELVDAKEPVRGFLIKSFFSCRALEDLGMVCIVFMIATIKRTLPGLYNLSISCNLDLRVFLNANCLYQRNAAHSCTSRLHPVSNVIFVGLAQQPSSTPRVNGLSASTSLLAFLAPPMAFATKASSLGPMVHVEMEAEGRDCLMRCSSRSEDTGKKGDTQQLRSIEVNEKG